MLVNWNDEVGVAVASGTVDNGQGQRRNTAASFLAALALGISLLQGPGALHHFPDDVADLATVVNGVSRLLDHLTDQLDEFNR